MDQQEPKPYQPKPRFLAASGRWDPVQAKRDQKLREAGEPIPDSEEDHGYTDLPGLALPREPECLDQDDWDRYVAKDAKQRKAAREAGVELAMKLLSQEERVVNVNTEAKARRRDISREMYAYSRMKAQGRPPQVLEKRVQAMERVVFLGRAA